MEKYQQILGSFLGAAMGDAMGANTECRTPEMIVERFGGYLEDLRPGEEDTFVPGCARGFVTDDFSLAYFTAKSILESGGNVTADTAQKALLEWAGHPEYYCLAGPTTRAAVDRIKGISEPDKALWKLACDNAKATNGAAMKIFPAGLANPGNLEKAVSDAVTLCLPTHNNCASLSAACAIAAAVSCAAGGGNLNQIIEAGFYGVREGAKYGKTVSVASVERRMELAMEIAEKKLGWEKTMLELGSVIGSGLAANEAVPCVFGILATADGDVMQAVKMGVNIGNDTDTVATMAGAITGAFCGADLIPEEYLELIEKANHMDIKEMARQFEKEFYL